MPRYLYQCDSCGSNHERIRSMREKNLWQSRCPGCGKKAGRDLGGEVRSGAGAAPIPDGKPYYSEAMGVAPGQRGLKGETYDADGRLLVKSNAHRRELMKLLDLRDRRSFG